MGLVATVKTRLTNWWLITDVLSMKNETAGLKRPDPLQWVPDRRDKWLKQAPA